ncbi:MAG: CHASE2 domain-containing protein [Bacteroidetes bacterium]|nr:MAG: CHASE2 domain-containing protein [Bacteroidota bacterium]
MKPKKIWLWTLSALHSLLLVGVSLFVLSLPDTLDDEVFLITYTSLFRKLIIHDDDKPDSKRFLFVNVAWEKQLIPKNDKHGFPIGTQAITDRKQLGKFLQILNQKPDNHQFLFMDIFFTDSTDQDDLIRKELPKVKNCLISYHKDKNDKPVYPIFKAPLGLSDMESDRPMVIKYKLIQGDSLKTTPLLLYEKLHNINYEEGFLWDYLGETPILNSFILDYRIRPYNVFEDTLYSKVYLGELLSLPAEVVHEFTKDRIILLGDFEDRDIHKTIYDKMPGTLILLNAFLSLESKDNEVQWSFLFYLFIGYLFVSVKIFMIKDPLTQWVERKLGKDSFMVALLIDVTFFLVYLAIMSIISYFLFNIHLAILFLSFYMYGLLLVLSFIDEWLTERRRKIGEQMEVFNQ